MCPEELNEGGRPVPAQSRHVLILGAGFGVTCTAPSLEKWLGRHHDLEVTLVAREAISRSPFCFQRSRRGHLKENRRCNLE
jgi:NADH dehydrogenase FAD-containing subunit